MKEAIGIFKSRLRQKSRLICTWGDQGAAGIDHDGQEVFVNAEKVGKVVDTCGAGDTFTASVIAYLMKGLSLKESMSHGCQLAAKKIQQRGFRDLVMTS